MSAELLQHALELLSPLGATRSRRMFGGHGIYVNDLFIAIIAFEQLYLKADEQTCTQFEAAGCTAFHYDRLGQTATMRYYAAPEDAMESAGLMLPWGRLAMEAALRAHAAKAVKSAKSRKPARKPPLKAQSAPSA